MTSSLSLMLDERTRRELDALSQSEGIAPSEMAARLLRRTVRARRPRPVYDIDALQKIAQSFAGEDTALAESDREHRAALLAAEDAVL